MKDLPTTGPILSPELFRSQPHNDTQGLFLPAAVMAGLLTGLIYLIM